MVDRKRLAGPALGIVLYSTGVFLFALNDALGKWLVVNYSAQQLLLFRSMGTLLVLVPAYWRNPVALMPRQWGLSALRVLCMAVDSFAFYFATRYLPLADVMTFYLAAPLIITALSVPILGEKVGAFRWAAVLVGFVGVVIAMRPSSASFSPAALIAFGGACMFACAITTTRKLRDTPSLTLIIWQFVGSGIFGGILSPIDWVTPSLLDLGLMAVLGITAMTCFFCIIGALKLTRASVIAPLQYASIVWATALGWLFWGDVPDLPTAIGVVIIVGSGLAVWWHEQSRFGAETAEAVPVP